MILNPFIPLVDCRGVVKVNRAFVIRCQVKVINTKISIILPRISYSIIFDFYFVIIEFFSLQSSTIPCFFPILLVIFFSCFPDQTSWFLWHNILRSVEIVNKTWSRCQLEWLTKYFLDVYPIHQMVSRIFCNYEATNFSRNWVCLFILMYC